MATPLKTVWNQNQDLATAMAAAASFDSADVDFDSTTTYFSGYDPTSYTREGSVPKTWAKEGE